MTTPGQLRIRCQCSPSDEWLKSSTRRECAELLCASHIWPGASASVHHRGIGIDQRQIRHILPMLPPIQGLHGR